MLCLGWYNRSHQLLQMVLPGLQISMAQSLESGFKLQIAGEMIQRGLCSSHLRYHYGTQCDIIVLNVTILPSYHIISFSFLKVCPLQFSLFKLHYAQSGGVGDVCYLLVLTAEHPLFHSSSFSFADLSVTVTQTAP